MLNNCKNIDVIQKKSVSAIQCVYGVTELLKLLLKQDFFTEQTSFKKVILLDLYALLGQFTCQVNGSVNDELLDLIQQINKYNLLGLYLPNDKDEGLLCNRKFSCYERLISALGAHDLQHCFGCNGTQRVAAPICEQRKLFLIDDRGQSETSALVSKFMRRLYQQRNLTGVFFVDSSLAKLYAMKEYCLQNSIDFVGIYFALPSGAEKYILLEPELAALM